MEQRNKDIFRRAVADTREFCVSFRFLVIVAVIGILAGVSKEWLVAPIGFFAMIGIVFVVMCWLAPVRQRDEAQNDLYELRKQLEAPIGVEMKTTPSQPIQLHHGDSTEVIITVLISNNHPEDIASVVMSFEVPMAVGLQYCSQAGSVIHAGAYMDAHNGNTHWWTDKQLTLPGGGWASTFWFKLVIQEAGMIDIALKLRLPGFDSVGKNAKLPVIQQEPTSSIPQSQGTSLTDAQPGAPSTEPSGP